MPRHDFGADAADHIRRKLLSGGPLWSSLVQIQLEAGRAITFLPEGCEVVGVASLDRAILGSFPDLECFHLESLFVYEYLKRTPASVALFTTNLTADQPMMKSRSLPIAKIAGMEGADYGQCVVLTAKTGNLEAVGEALAISESPFPFGLLSAGPDALSACVRDSEFPLTELQHLGLGADCLIVEAFRGEGLLFWIRPDSDLFRSTFR